MSLREQGHKMLTRKLKFTLPQKLSNSQKCLISNRVLTIGWIKAGWVLNRKRLFASQKIVKNTVITGKHRTKRHSEKLGVA
jgi:hypothetical protein